MSPELKDARLTPIYEKMLDRIGNSVADVLEEAKLVNKEGEPQAPFTLKGLEFLATNIVGAIQVQFMHMRVEIPSQYMLDEISLVEHFSKGTGIPTVELTERKTIRLTFPGEIPLIREMEVPLDPSDAVPIKTNADGKPVTAHTELGMRHVLKPGQVVHFPETNQKPS
jgi:hypothetical protein